MIKIQPVTTSSHHHSFPPLYEQWGRVGSTEGKFLSAERLRSLDQTIRQHHPELHLSSLKPFLGTEVALYQGTKLPNKKVIFVRYQANEGTENGEHVSVLLDPKTHQLMGLTQMLAEMETLELPSPQEAMNTAIEFLAKQAPDLISKTETFNFKAKKDDHVTFNETVPFENVSFQWVGHHDETIEVNGKPTLIKGVKVKMHIPKLGLWAWVIVGKGGEVLTFERNIAWDFKAQQRLTQMWLHSQWL